MSRRFQLGKRDHGVLRGRGRRPGATVTSAGSQSTRGVASTRDRVGYQLGGIGRRRFSTDPGRGPRETDVGKVTSDPTERAGTSRRADQHDRPHVRFTTCYRPHDRWPVAITGGGSRCRTPRATCRSHWTAS
jgi:hypothetical protein